MSINLEEACDVIKECSEHWQNNLFSYEDIVSAFFRVSDVYEHRALKSEENLEMINLIHQNERNLCILSRKAEIFMDTYHLVETDEDKKRIERMLKSIMKAVQEYNPCFGEADEAVVALVLRIKESLQLE